MNTPLPPAMATLYAEVIGEVCKAVRAAFARCEAGELPGITDSASIVRSAPLQEVVGDGTTCGGKRRRVRYTDDTRLRATCRRNPYREGSTRWVSYQTLLASETYAQYVEEGGAVKFLRVWYDEGRVDIIQPKRGI